jgi:hypothetical protein
MAIRTRNSQMDGDKSATDIITRANGEVRFARDGHESSSRADEWATRTEHNFALENQAISLCKQCRLGTLRAVILNQKWKSTDAVLSSVEYGFGSHGERQRPLKVKGNECVAPTAPQA